MARPVVGGAGLEPREEAGELAVVVVEGAGGRQHHHPGAGVGGGEFGRLVGGLHRVGEHPLKGVHVGLGDLVGVGAAPDRPGPVDHQPGADGGRVAALRVGLAPPLEPVVVLLGQFLEDFQARPAFVPVLPGRLDVGGGLLPLPRRAPRTASTKASWPGSVRGGPARSGSSWARGTRPCRAGSNAARSRERRTREAMEATPIPAAAKTKMLITA